MIIKQLTQRPWLSALVASLVLSAPLAQAQLKSIDRITAVVDDDIIMHSELNSRVDVVKNQSKGMRLPPDDILKQQVLERLITESIQMQMAERSGVRISDQQLNQTIETIAKQNGMSLRQFQQALEKDGVPMPKLANKFVVNALFQKFSVTVWALKFKSASKTSTAF